MPLLNSQNGESIEFSEFEKVDIRVGDNHSC